MTTVQAAHTGEAVPPALDGFEVEYVTEYGAVHRVELADAWPVRFELAAPVRLLRSRHGQRHLPGRWWSATDGGHVGYESWLERDHVMLLDFDPTASTATIRLAVNPLISWLWTAAGVSIAGVVVAAWPRKPRSGSRRAEAQVTAAPARGASS